MENTLYTEDDNNLLNPQEFIHYEYATTGQRFLNWLIDNILMRFGLSYLSGLLLGLILSVIAPDMLNEIAADGVTASFSVFCIIYLVAVLNYLVYYTICEKLFRGYTLGKIITGTRAIRQDGAELTLKDAFLRSASRLVPFEIFSGFNTLTWHDSWTNTMVIKSR